MISAVQSLGPVTEARFAEAFAHAAVVGKSVAADLLGLDEKTVDTLTSAKILRSVPKGAKHRGYTERDLRAFLIDSPEIPCPAPEPRPRPKSAPMGNLRVVNFSERRRGHR
ncbi:MAG: regulatory protein MerR [Phenylobacterium sp.]|nr:regulatory protein MerR [Phenylobacterium sp.]